MYWTRQDQLLYGSLLALLSRDLASMVASAKISQDLSKKLSISYAKPSALRIIMLRENLVKSQRSRNITTYMFDIRAAQMS